MQASIRTELLQFLSKVVEGKEYPTDGIDVLQGLEDDGMITKEEYNLLHPVFSALARAEQLLWPDQ